MIDSSQTLDEVEEVWFNNRPAATQDLERLSTTPGKAKRLAVTGQSNREDEAEEGDDAVAASPASATCECGDTDLVRTSGFELEDGPDTPYDVDRRIDGADGASERTDIESGSIAGRWNTPGSNKSFSREWEEALLVAVRITDRHTSAKSCAIDSELDQPTACPSSRLIPAPEVATGVDPSGPPPSPSLDRSAISFHEFDVRDDQSPTNTAIDSRAEYYCPTTRSTSPPVAVAKIPSEMDRGVSVDGPSPMSARVCRDTYRHAGMQTDGTLDAMFRSQAPPPKAIGKTESNGDEGNLDAVLSMSESAVEESGSTVVPTPPSLLVAVLPPRFPPLPVSLNVGLATEEKGGQDAACPVTMQQGNDKVSELSGGSSFHPLQQTHLHPVR